MPVFPEVVGRAGERNGFLASFHGIWVMGRRKGTSEGGGVGGYGLGNDFGGIDETTGEKVAAIRIK